MNDVAAATDGIAASARASERRLSFAFAKRHGVLVKRLTDEVAECACRDNAAPLAIAEVRRYLRRSLKLERVRAEEFDLDRKSTRLNSSHGYISYAVFCLKKKKALQLESL